MHISNYVLNIDRLDVAAYYELKTKKYERDAFMVMGIVILAMFSTLPMFITRFVFHLFGDDPEITWIIESSILLGLVLMAMMVLLTTGTYNSGKLYKWLLKNNDLDGMLKCIVNRGEDIPHIRVAYIIHFKQYRHAYITNDGMLAIVYHDNGKESCYSTCVFEDLCSESCKEASLLVDGTGIRLMDREP